MQDAIIALASNAAMETRRRIVVEVYRELWNL